MPYFLNYGWPKWRHLLLISKQESNFVRFAYIFICDIFISNFWYRYWFFFPFYFRLNVNEETITNLYRQVRHFTFIYSQQRADSCCFDFNLSKKKIIVNYFIIVFWNDNYNREFRIRISFHELFGGKISWPHPFYIFLYKYMR